MNLKQFNVSLDNKLSFFVFLLFFVGEQRRPKQVVVLLDTSILSGKKSAASRSKYL